jgi:hypothetical protein
MRDRRLRIVSTTTGMSRRAALGRLGAIGLGLAAAGCASAPQALTGALYPDGVVLDEASVQGTLAAFVEAVIRDGEAAPAVTRLLADPALKFAPFRRGFAADLRRRASDLAGDERFERLPLEDRTRLIRAGLDDRGIRARLYNGAVFLTQIAYFAGLWHPRGECPAISFEGAYVYRGDAAVTWPHPEAYLPVALTADGNPS